MKLRHGLHSNITYVNGESIVTLILCDANITLLVDLLRKFKLTGSNLTYLTNYSHSKLPKLKILV